MKSSKQIESWLQQKVGFEIMDPGLERVQYVIQELNLTPNCKIITIGGTNGKGSVSRLLTSTLAQKYKVSLFTSPHLYSISERFLFQGEFIELVRLEQYLKTTFEFLEKSETRLSYYELLFIAFLKWIKDVKPDFVILEVGLGGRLDAVNAIDADIAVITSIGRDHQEFLGSTYKKILMEKLGIAREGAPLVAGLDLVYLTQRASHYCHQRAIPFTNIMETQNFNLKNEKIVKTVLELLQEKIPLGKLLKNDNNKYFDFYGSHNPEAVRKLVQFLLQEHYNNKEKKYDLLILSFSHRKEKDLVHMIKLFKMLHPKIVGDIVLTVFEHFKAESEEVIKKIANENGIEFVKDIENQISSDKTYLVSGSNYFYRSIADKFENSRKI